MGKPSPDKDRQPRAPRDDRKHRLLILIVCFLLLIAIYIILKPTNIHHNNPLVREYAGEKIQWHLCDENDGYELECSSVVVPMDHFDSARSANDTFTIPLIRIRGKPASKNLFVNPGGPGASGIEFIYRAGRHLKTIVGEDYHILGFDPRGVNASQPAALCYPDQKARKRFSSARADDLLRDGPELYSWTENFAQACVDTAGRHGHYVNTPQTAADLNVILDAVGQRDMAYWGFSYGTTLGQTYATMYPERCESVIIDGVSNHFHHYESLVNPSKYVDSDKVLVGFFDECMKAGDDCALSRFAKDKTQLQSRVMGFIGNLTNEPLNVYINNTLYGTLDGHKILFGIFSHLYKPVGWYTLADELAQLMRGNGTAALLAYGLDDGEDAYSDHSRIINNNDAISGKDNWPQKEELQEFLLRAFNQSVFASELFSDYYTRAQWRIPKIHSYKPQKKVKTKSPMLILSQTWDPICPLTNAHVAKSIFEGSRVVEIKGYGHCSSAMPSTCLARYVRDFLNNGKVPDDDVQCNVDGRYFLNHELRSKAMAVGDAQDGTDEQKIWAAQLGLSEAAKFEPRRRERGRSYETTASSPKLQ